MTPTLSNGSSGLVPVGRAPLVGDVAEFDEQRGLGSIEYGPGQVIPFHCTAITDGTRRIEAGAVVSFRIAAGRLGRLEARSVRPLPGVVAPGSTLAPGQVGSGADVGAGAGEGERSASGHGSHLVAQPGAVSVSTGPESAVSEAAVWAVSVSTGPGLGVSEPVTSEPVTSEPVTSEPVTSEPVTSEPVTSEPVVSAVTEPPAPQPLAWPVDPTDVTPPSGMPPVEPDSPPVTVGSSVADSVPSPSTGVSEVSPEELTEESPHPDFWSLNPRPPSGPPPTWVTPVTRREPPSPSDSG
jgi:cold shock CspA family protein